MLQSALISAWSLPLIFEKSVIVHDRPWFLPAPGTGHVSVLEYSVSNWRRGSGFSRSSLTVARLSVIYSTNASAQEVRPNKTR